ncbi:MAG TPA: DUF4382 domain-containing protein [Nonomuraea sp.]|nr:DUF4382 domain-containing protein [Nonomuraea sp.]
MKRVLSTLLPLVLAACGGTARVNFALNSDDTQVGGLTDGSSSLAGVKAIHVTVAEVSAHVSDEQPGEGTEPAEVRGEDVADTDTGWQVVSSGPQELDLMSIRDNATAPLGEATLPAGKLTQIRMKLRTTGADGGGEDRIAGAVVDSNDQLCDLIVPHSVTEPGAKIVGAFRAANLEGGRQYNAIVNLKLTDSSRLSGTSTCAFRLNPVIKVKRVEVAPEVDAKK